MRSLLAIIFAGFVATLAIILWSSRSSNEPGTAAPVVEVAGNAVHGVLIDPSSPAVERESMATDAQLQSVSTIAADEDDSNSKPRPEAVLHVVALLLDSSGLPLANADITRTFFRGGSSAGWTIQSNKIGRVRFRIPRAFRYPQELLLSFSWNDGGLRSAVSDSVPLPAPKDGTIDVGRVKLRERSLLVAGHVIELDGTPISQAAVQLNWRGGPRRYKTARERKEQCVPQSVSTNELGAFRFFLNQVDPIEAIELRVEAQNIGFISRLHVPVRKGDWDLQVVLERGAILRGRALIDLPIKPFQALYVVALRNSDPIEYLSMGLVPMPEPGVDAPAGEFALTGISPGLCDIAFCLMGPGEDPILVIEDVEIPEAGLVDDPRLKAVDLTGMFAIRIEVLDEQGQELGGIIRLRRAGASEWALWPLMSADPARPGFVAAYPLVDVSISKPGYESVLLERICTDQRVVLQRTSPLESKTK